MNLTGIKGEVPDSIKRAVAAEEKNRRFAEHYGRRGAVRIHDCWIVPVKSEAEAKEMVKSVKRLLNDLGKNLDVYTVSEIIRLERHYAKPVNKITKKEAEAYFKTEANYPHLKAYGDAKAAEKDPPKTVDMVNAPPHYYIKCSDGRQIEVIDIIEALKLGFNRGNAVKYLLRAGNKGDVLEDLEKGAWYLKREISILKKARREIQERTEAHERFLKEGGGGENCRCSELKVVDQVDRVTEKTWAEYKKAALHKAKRK